MVCEPFEVQRLRLLGHVRMRRTGIAFELLEHRVAQRPFRQHALDRLFQHPSGEALLHLAERGGADAARIAAVAVVELVLGLVAGDLDLFDVGDDDEVARIDVRRVDRLVLAAQPVGDRAGEPAQHLVAGVDDVPIPLDVLGPGGIGFHGEIRVRFNFTKS